MSKIDTHEIQNVDQGLHSVINLPLQSLKPFTNCQEFLSG